MTRLPRLRQLPLGLQIAAILRVEIRRRPAGEKLEPESRLAARFGVSSATIRDALRTLATEGLIERRHGSGTYVRDFHAGQPIAIFTGMDLAPPRPPLYALAVIQQARRYLAELGLHSRLYTGIRKADDRHAASYPSELACDLEQGRVGGVIVITDSGRPPWLSLVERQGLPVVGCGPHYRCHTRHDSTAVAAAVADYLVSQGRTRFACIGWIDDARPGTAGQPSLPECFRGEVVRRGLPVQLGWWRTDLHPLDPAAGWEELREVWLGSRQKPDALYVTDDALFNDLAVGVQQLGIRVPEDLLVITHANEGIPLYASFPVARMVFSPREAARTGVDLLLAQRAGQPVPPSVTLTHRLEPLAADRPVLNPSLHGGPA